MLGRRWRDGSYGIHLFGNSVAFSFGTPPLLLGLVLPVEMFTSVLLPFIPRIGMKDHRLKWGFCIFFYYEGMKWYETRWRDFGSIWISESDIIRALLELFVLMNGILFGRLVSYAMRLQGKASSLSGHAIINLRNMEYGYISCRRWESSALPQETIIHIWSGWNW